jgi:hypothetical protein
MKDLLGLEQLSAEQIGYILDVARPMKSFSLGRSKKFPLFAAEPSRFCFLKRRPAPGVPLNWRQTTFR